MSEAIHFDTHKFVKRMTEAGMPEQTAEAQADEQLRFIQGELANKQDLALVQHDIALLKQDVVAVQQDIALLKQDVAVLDATVRQGLAESKSELLKWLVGMQLTTISAMVAALAFLVS